MKDITKSAKISSSRLESKIEANCIRKSIELGWFPVKLGHQGHPDRFFIKQGKIVFIEFKRLNGKLSKLQKYTHAIYAAMGEFRVHICRSVKELEDILNNAESN